MNVICIAKKHKSFNASWLGLLKVGEKYKVKYNYPPNYPTTSGLLQQQGAYYIESLRQLYPKDLFITEEEYRENKLSQILD